MEPLVSRLLARVQAEAGLGPVTLQKCIISGKDKIVLKAATSGEGVIVKLPTDAATFAGEANNARILRMLAQNPRPDVPAPEPLSQGTLQQVAYFAERAVPGVPLAQTASADERGAFAAKVARLVRALGKPGKKSETITPGSALHRRLVVDPGAKLRQAGLSDDACKVMTDRANEALVHASWRFGLAHGDLSVHNLFVANGEISGVIDWEYADEDGVPALDFIGYLESRQRLEDPASNVLTNLLRLARFDWPCSEELSALRDIYVQFNIDSAQHHDLCLLAWIGHVNCQLDGADRFDSAYAEQLIATDMAQLAGAG
jgi:aminoglycoside phosphotransferase (APT) family kinase protein